MVEPTNLDPRQIAAVEAIITEAVLKEGDPSRRRLRVARLIPAAACAWYGCPGRPRWWLGRFADRPWRCEQCRTWWITRQSRDSIGDFRWYWEPVTDEAPDDEKIWRDASRG